MVERIDDLSAARAMSATALVNGRLRFLVIRLPRVGAIVGGHADDADAHALEPVGSRKLV